MHLSMVCPRLGWGEGGGQPTGIRLSEVHVGREFDILNVPRVGNWLSRHLGKCRTWECVIRGPPSQKIPSSHLDEFPTFWWAYFFSEMAERKLGVSCCFEVWSFMTKSIFPLHWEATLAQSLIWKYAFFLDVFTRYCPDTILGDPGAVSRVWRKGGTKVSFQVRAKKEPLGTDSHRTIS